MASRDIKINCDLIVRKYDPPDQLFEIRVGPPNWHREAASLTKAEAKKLRDELNEFLEGK